MNDKISDEEFMKLAESRKPCKYCGASFVGPVCPCERPIESSAVAAEAPSDRARGWIDLDDLRRRIAKFAEDEARSAGIVGACADVRIDMPDGNGSRRIAVEVPSASDVPGRAARRDEEGN